MKRRVFSLVVPLLLMLTLSAQAAEARIGRNRPVLNFDGTTAVCSVLCKADGATDKVTATLTLYQGGTYVDSWSDSGTGRVYVSGSCEVESGKSYRLVLSYSVNGEAKPSVPVTGTCP